MMDISSKEFHCNCPVYVAILVGRIEWYRAGFWQICAVGIQQRWNNNLLCFALTYRLDPKKVTKISIYESDISLLRDLLESRKPLLCQEVPLCQCSFWWLPRTICRRLLLLIQKKTFDQTGYLGLHVEWQLLHKWLSIIFIKIYY